MARLSIEAPEPEPEPSLGGDDELVGEQSSSKRKLDELFFLWLGLPETSELVTGLVRDMRAGKSLTVPARVGSPSSSPSPLSPVSRLLRSNRDIGGDCSPSRHQPTTPPRSPKSPKSPKSGLCASTTLATDGLPPASPRASLSRPAPVIPQFYFPPGVAVTPPQEEARLCRRADELFGSGTDDRLGVDALRDVCAQVAGLPRFFAAKIVDRLGGSLPADSVEVDAEGPTVAKADFMNFWKSELKDASLAGRVFAVLKRPGAKFVVPQDWHAVLQELLETHAGLDFLRETKEFQARYVETVIARIYYTLDRRGLGRLTLRDIERGELLAALSLVDTDDDINKEMHFFSYEHFYVLYCKFWELDTDHDLEINR
jgi:serine/threonine-protein phosphatase 2A regulatory subunit B''